MSQGEKHIEETAKSLQSCPTLCDPIDSSPPGSPVPGILQARTLEWVAISFSNAWKWKVKVKSLSRVWPSATPWTEPTRLLHPWDFPGKSTGGGCHCLLHTFGKTHSNFEPPRNTLEGVLPTTLQFHIFSYFVNSLSTLGRSPSSGIKRIISTRVCMQTKLWKPRQYCRGWRTCSYLETITK